MTSAYLLSDPRFAEHQFPGYHPERPQRLDAAHAAIQRACGESRQQFVPVAAREAHADELVRVHTPDFVEWMSVGRGHHGHIDADTYMGPHSARIARLAAGGVIDLTRHVFASVGRPGVALVRPPGHHARPGQAMGFCLLNNVALAAVEAKRLGARRIAIVDWDVHHGNGTQEVFYRDPSVLCVWMHQSPLSPGTGAARETGDGDGRGYTVNLPMSAGATDGIYRGAMERVVLPIVEEYRPDYVIISAGFDASLRDPLAEMCLSAQCFGWMARELRRIADRSAKGRMLIALEGGYDLPSLEQGLFATLQGALEGTAQDIDRNVDHPDLSHAQRAASASWRSVKETLG